MFLITFVVMVLAVLGMAIGVLSGGRELKGSCGGLNSTDGSCPCGRSEPCETESGTPSKIRVRNADQTSS